MFLGTEEEKDQKLVSSLSEYNHFTTFARETLRQVFTRFSIIVTRLLSSGAERSNQEINLRFLEGLGKDWMLVKMLLQDSGKLKTYNMYRLYNNLVGQKHDIKGTQQQLQLGGPLALVAEHNYPTMGNTPQQLVQYQQATQQPIYMTTANNQNASVSQIAPIQYQPPPTSQQSIQSKTPNLALPAPVQIFESCYSEYDEAEEASYQHEIAMISQKFNRIPSYSSPKKYFRPSNQNGGHQSKYNYQKGHHQSGQNRYYPKPEKQHQEKPKAVPAVSTNQVHTPEKNESELIKCHNCGGLWHYAADYRAPRNYSKEKEEEKVTTFVASGNVEIWSSGDEDEHFENKLEDRKLFCDKLTADLKIEQTSWILLENSNQLLTSQRDLARSDNVSLNKLVDQLYHATEIFKSPANTNSSENTFNWGWARKTANKNYPIYNKQNPCFQYRSNEYDDKHDEDTTRSLSEIPINESESAISESKKGVRILFSYLSEADNAESSKLSTTSVSFMPRHMTTVPNNPLSSSQQHSFIENLQSNCVTEEFNLCLKDLENSNEENVDEEIEMQKRPSSIIIKNDFNKIIIRNPNVVNTPNTTSEPSCSGTKSYVEALQHNFSNNSNRNKTPLEKLKVNHEESDSLNDSLSDSSPREIFQKGKGQNLTKNGIKPNLNRKDLRSPRSHASAEEQDDELLIDSACSMHMTGRLEFLRDYREVNFGGYVTFGNDANGIIKGYGVLTNGNFTIQKVAYVLILKYNIVSVGQLVSTGLRVEFDNEFSYIMTGTRDRCLVKSPRQLNMFPLDISMFVRKPRLGLLSKAYSEVSWLWHRKLVHLNFRYMNQLVTGEMVRGMPLLKFDNESLCVACALGKQKKKPYKSITDSSITRPLELLSQRPLWLKSDTFLELRNFITSVELKVQLPVRRIRSDNGTEFNNGQIEEFLASKGIEHNFSAPYMPQQNGVVERRNRTRTRDIEESFDIEFDDQYHWRKKNQGILYVMENDVPVGHQPIHTVEIDYDLLFDPPEIATNAEVIHSPEVIQQIISASGPSNSSKAITPDDQLGDALINSSEDASKDAPIFTFEADEDTSAEESHIQDISPESSDPVQDIPPPVSDPALLPRLHKWTQNHPPNQIIGSPSSGVQTRSKKSIQDECQFAAYMIKFEPKTVFDALDDDD
ncbi:hypothetical protein L2E82_38185 [Cichorium intybus]|uniref:Uncharacterized protein n=1 Tax=Cichorium intybus TaxID=13427 RepID=A0ACB9AGX4_CICIN|nr:hypothetical protein L2E82_38185 [Cichorium intybus]